ncbi:hypothetical protein [Aequorivita sp. CIP111184]|uniref:hypothetical protein n=1 Tax=Aequorivita sp. CIP111184 TaxID=2211356 RepID=UPI000DCF7BE9|nr:hypothetical protein [Aequorivita sp. CIP111184]
MKEHIIHFKQKGFPDLRIYADYFEVKARDHWEFRTFRFSEVQKIRYYDPNNNWWTPIAMVFSRPYMSFYAQKKYYYLRIYKNSGGYWNYITPEFVSLDLITALREVKKRSGNITLQSK